jgi:hypothetical protein
MSHPCKYCFQVQLHNFKTQETEVLSLFSDRRDAVENLEEVVIVHLKEKNGDLKFDVNNWTKTHLFDLSKLTDAKKEELQVGYYATRDVKEDVNKFTVWEKKVVTNKVPGVIYGQWKNKAVVHEKVFDVNMVKVKDELVPAHRRRSHQVTDFNECYDTTTPYYDQQQLLIQQFKSLKSYKFLTSSTSVTKVLDIRSEFVEEFIKCPMAAAIKAKTETPTRGDLHDELRATIKKKLTEAMAKQS